MEKLATIIGGIVMIVAIVIFFAMLAAFPTKWLWNWLMPDLFSLKEITVWQAWGLLALSGLLLKSSVSKKE